MSFAFEPVSGAALLLGLWMVGITLLSSSLLLYALQTILLGSLAAWIGSQHHEPALIVAGIAVAVLKGIAAPIYLASVTRRIDCRRDSALIFAPPLLQFFTLGALGVLFLIHPFGEEFTSNATPALGLLLIGMMLMVSRKLAIGQILGFLVLENGMFFYAVSQPHSMPLVVELGVLLDVLVGTMIAGMLIFRIRESFEHIDLTEMKQLRG